jgi:hypothetical protein
MSLKLPALGQAFRVKTKTTAREVSMKAHEDVSVPKIPRRLRRRIS